MPRIITSTKLRRNLGIIIEALKRGDSFVITYRSRIVADMMPASPARIAEWETHQERFTPFSPEK